MSIVTLVSGGLDSTLVALLARDEGLEQYPLFVDYGQRAKDKISVGQKTPCVGYGKNKNRTRHD
jgi:7-cyano-7-deazaguanine synthase in queuosine biosynthesis